MSDEPDAADFAHEQAAKMLGHIHVTMEQSDRGFAFYPPVESTYGGDVQVSESSSAEYPRIWLWAKSPVDINGWFHWNATGREGEIEWQEASAHLDVADALALALQLLHAVANHYHWQEG